MKSYAIIRHAKIKSGQHLVSAGLHNVRGAPTPNADRDAPAVEILVGSDRPDRDVMDFLRERGVLDRPLRKNANVAVEVMLAASPDWWASKGWSPGVEPTGATKNLVEAWKHAQLIYLRDRFGDTLVSAAFHPDEASPHVQAFVVPVQWRRDGREKGEHAGREAWRLSTEKLLRGPAHMKSIVSDYAAKMAGFGLVRGEDRATGTTWHKPLKAWQAEQQQLKRKMEDEVERQVRASRELEDYAARRRREADEYAARVEAELERKRKDDERILAMQTERLRRATDDTAQRERLLADEYAAIDAERTKVRKELAEVSSMKRALKALHDEFDRLMEPIRVVAAKFVAASPLMRQAMPKGREAADVMTSADVLHASQRRSEHGL